MDNRITELTSDPYSVVLAGRKLALLVDPPTGDVFLGSPVLLASKGLTFSLIPGPGGHLLRLLYRDISIDVGWTDDVVAATSWVQAVNAFLETKRGAAVANGTPMPTTSVGSTVV